MLKKVEWGEFKLQDILEWQDGISEINPLYLDHLYDENAVIYPFYGQATKDNGIISYNKLTPKVLNNPSGKPTILIHSNNQNIVYLETPFYLKDGHGATSVLQAEWLTKKIALYLISVIGRNIRYKFSYQNKATKIALKNTVIPLPIKNKQLAFETMENFIAQLEAYRLSQLEAYRLSQLEAYLLVTGLKDYQLTEEEKQVLIDFQNGKVKWEEVELQELFQVETSKKRFDANKVTILNSGYPYIVRTAMNNGVRGYLKENEEYLNEGNTISFGQDTATMFYQKRPYFTGDKIKILKSRFPNFNTKEALFFITLLGRAFSIFSWGSSSFSEKMIKSQKVIIPQKYSVNEEKFSEIDSNFMQTLISAVQKLVIKDVVLYADRKIAATKEVIKG